MLYEVITNIHHHYNLGNAFYRLWLDREAMQYTCAYYPAPGMTLEAAQRAKMDHVCRKLRLRSGQRVIEAGFGWGGFALHMARHYGVSVRAYNIVITSYSIHYTKLYEIAEFLVREKIPYVFGLCGHGNVGLLDALYEVADKVKYVSPRHEQVAGHMADGYFRVAHRPVATLTSTGPGSANLRITSYNVCYTKLLRPLGV